MIMISWNYISTLFWDAKRGTFELVIMFTYKQARVKDSAESETSQLSRIRLGPLRDESESRVGRLNSEETDSAENRSWLDRLDIMMMILCLIAIQYGNNYITMYLWM